MLRTALFGAIAAMTFTASSAAADLIHWKTVGWWDISFYSEQEGCLAQVDYDDGTTFFIGFARVDGEVMMDITLIDESWQSLEPGKEYPIEVRFGNESPWTVEMYADLYGDDPGLAVLLTLNGVNADRFIDEFQRKSDMVWSFRGHRLGHFNLRGSRRAMDETIACQRSYNSAVNRVDPFAASATADPFASNDPFAN